MRYVDDRRPGITRKLVRGHFVYFDPQGQRIRNEAEIKRIDALAVPPAYTDYSPNRVLWRNGAQTRIAATRHASRLEWAARDQAPIPWKFTRCFRLITINFIWRLFDCIGMPEDRHRETSIVDRRIE
ncbi:hypothetical protein [Trinickia sp.]|uniref:hypothetical protein n=1 Tax=Trinickia sp. TaxID=2571163 RepID=UPI0039C929FB